MSIDKLTIKALKKAAKKTRKAKRREPYMDNPENKYTWYLGEYCKHPTDDTKCLLRWSLIKVNEK